MKQHRGSVIGPLILITIGVLFLLANLGYVSGSVWLVLIQFWPVLLILAGLEILLGRTVRGQIVVLVIGVLAVAGIVWLVLNPGRLAFGPSMRTETLGQSGDGVQSANLELNTGVGELIIKPSDADSSNWIEGTIAHPGSLELEQQYQVTNGAAQMKLDTTGNVVFFGNSLERWDIRLAPQVPLNLRVNGGVGGSNLDLNALNATQLNLDTGVGGMDVVLPSHAGTVTAVIDGGIGGLNIYIPQGVPARIRSHTGIGGMSINAARFPRVGDDLYESPDYATAANRIDLSVNSGIGGITIP